MQSDPSERPLTEEEIEQLFDDAAREVRAAKAAGIAPGPDLPPELLEDLKPSLAALKRIFGKKRQA